MQYSPFAFRLQRSSALQFPYQSTTRSPYAVEILNAQVRDLGEIECEQMNETFLGKADSSKHIVKLASDLDILLKCRTLKEKKQELIKDMTTKLNHRMRSDLLGTNGGLNPYFILREPGVQQQIHLSPTAHASAGNEGIAIANPISNALLQRGHKTKVSYAPQAVAIAGPYGIAHAQSDLYLDYV